MDRSVKWMLTAAAVALVGCGQGAGVLVTSPAAGRTVSAVDGRVNVTFDLDGVSVGTVESCGSRTDCGEAQLTLVSRASDAAGTQVDEPCRAPGAEWNSRGTGRALDAVLSHCPRETGRFAVRVAVYRYAPEDWPRADRLLALSDEVEFSVGAP